MKASGYALEEHAFSRFKNLFYYLLFGLVLEYGLVEHYYFQFPSPPRLQDTPILTL